MLLQIAISIATILLPLLMTIIPFAADPYDKERKRITGAGIWFIVLGLLSTFGAWYEKSSNNSESKSLRDDIRTLNGQIKQRDSAEKAAGVLYNEDTKKLIVIDSAILKRVEVAVKIEERPTIIMGRSVGHNPKISKLTDSVYTFKITVMTNSTVIATNIRDRYYKVFIKKGTAIWFDSTKLYSLSKDLTLSNSPPLLLTYHISTTRLPDTIIHFVKLRYTNKDGVEQVPFRKIFITTPNDLDKEINETHDLEYQAFKKMFIKAKVW